MNDETQLTDERRLEKEEIEDLGTVTLARGEHVIPKLARRLCPLEPRHVNGVSIPAKYPPDIPTEHLLID